MAKLFHCPIAISFFFILYSLFSTPAHAAGEFSTSYDVVYEVLENGETEVTQNISLTNLIKDSYAAEYTLIIGSPRLSGVAASDAQGPLKVTVESDETSSRIHMVFNQQVVGQGKTLNWRLKYKSLDTAVKNGLIWEINIPRLSPQTEIEGYDVALKVPTSFGPLMFVSPKPVSQRVSESMSQEFVFNKEQMQIGGASASFGEYQLFSFTLKYHLTNPRTFSGTATIALPPNIRGRQEIIFEKLEPEPLKIYQDEDGNYLADYKLSGRQNLDVEFVGYARVFNQSIDIAGGGSFSKLPAKLVELYTKPQPFWEVDDSGIQAQAKAVINRQKTVAENARAIYDFVSQRLTYAKDARKSLAERTGAVKALNETEGAVCMGYTDLFIALARAAGIPARELNGYAYTADNVLRPISIEFRGTDVLHSWPEFYDPHFGWVAIDPTWGSTTNGLDYFSKLDTNHFVFAIKGLSSEQPLPAGAYKLEDTPDGDVRVGFADQKTTGQFGSEAVSLEADFELGQTKIAGLPLSGKIKVKNTGTRTAFDVKASLQSEALFIAVGKENPLEDILPGEEKEFKVTLHAPRFNLRAEDKLKLLLEYQNFDGEVQESVFEHPVAVYPFFNYPLSWVHLLILFVTLIGATTILLLKIRNTKFEFRNKYK